MQHSDIFNPVLAALIISTLTLRRCPVNVEILGLPSQGQGYLQYQEMSWTSSSGTISTAASTSSPQALSPTAPRQPVQGRLSHTSGRSGRKYAAPLPGSREIDGRLSVDACMRGKL